MYTNKVDMILIESAFNDCKISTEYDIKSL